MTLANKLAILVNGFLAAVLPVRLWIFVHLEIVVECIYIKIGMTQAVPYE